MMAGLTALLVGYCIAPWIIKKLAGVKQPVRTSNEVGEELAGKHNGKENTPTMGGIIIILAIVISSLMWVKPFQEIGYVQHVCIGESRSFDLSSVNSYCPDCGKKAVYDSDNDGLADAWEHLNHGTLAHSGEKKISESETCMDAYLASRKTKMVINAYVLTALIVFLGLSVVGFLDDYLKVSRKNSKGLPGRYKILGQSLVAMIALGVLLSSELSAENMREIWVPFYRHVVMESAPLWMVGILLFLVLVGSSNAINLTDGLDGLATGCTVSVALAYGVMAYIVGNFVLSDTLLIEQVLGVGELAVICTSLLGACLAFLWYNSAPAEVFMGDTGSLALGGLVGVIAFMVQQPFTLVIVGGIFVMEALSVILQVGNYKLNGKRILKMAPIHHHFELNGWAETKVVIRFWILSLIFAIAGLASLKIR